MNFLHILAILPLLYILISTLLLCPVQVLKRLLWSATLGITAVLFCWGLAGLVGCATNNDNIVYQSDCRAYPVTKKCIEVPMGRNSKLK